MRMGEYHPEERGCVGHAASTAELLGIYMWAELPLMQVNGATRFHGTSGRSASGAASTVKADSGGTFCYACERVLTYRKNARAVAQVQVQYG